jgi:hypothetical protein
VARVAIKERTLWARKSGNVCRSRTEPEAAAAAAPVAARKREAAIHGGVSETRRRAEAVRAGFYYAFFARSCGAFPIASAGTPAGWEVALGAPWSRRAVQSTMQRAGWRIGAVAGTGVGTERAGVEVAGRDAARTCLPR